MTKTSPINQHGQYRKTIIDNKTVQGRVTIFGKAKTRTMDGHFLRDQMYGLIIFF